MEKSFKQKLLLLAAMYRELHPRVICGETLFGICECLSDVSLDYAERVYIKKFIDKLPRISNSGYRWPIHVDEDGHTQRAEWLDALANSLPDGFVVPELH